MCGIIGAAATRDISEVLLQGLARLEYRGYDSAGIALLQADGALMRLRCVGGVQELHNQAANNLGGGGITGVAHTRWASHGAPSEANAHPLVSDSLALVHNGIIENAESLRRELVADGYVFESETDSEVVVHLLHQLSGLLEGDLIAAVKAATGRLEGAFALAIIDQKKPEQVIATRVGNGPMVIGMAEGENFVASDIPALQGLADKIVTLEEGDIAQVTPQGVRILDYLGHEVSRPPVTMQLEQGVQSLGQYQYYMQKEIFEQPASTKAALVGHLNQDCILEPAFGQQASRILDKTAGVVIVACGSSYLAACVARYWLEELAGLPCSVEIASEYRYRRQPPPPPATLFVTISQSGETADTLAAFKHARTQNYLATLSICNVPTSSLPRLSDVEILLNAGIEIGVASTKTLSAQLAVLMLLTIALGRKRGLSREQEQTLVAELWELPNKIAEALRLDADIQQCAQSIANREHALFVGRGFMYPIALEGALKLKEISYIHAEGYAAGELKHGPLALVDEEMPVVALVPNNHLTDKLKSNLQEVHTRGGNLYVFADQGVTADLPDCTLITLPEIHQALAPILYLIPLQLLAYHVAIYRDTNPDRPRNLAKSVTVE